MDHFSVIARKLRLYCMARKMPYMSFNSTRQFLFYVIPTKGLLGGSKSTLDVIPWLDHGIQLKILIKLVFFIIFSGLPHSLYSLAMTIWYPHGQCLPASAGMTLSLILSLLSFELQLAVLLALVVFYILLLFLQYN